MGVGTHSYPMPVNTVGAQEVDMFGKPRMLAI